jgi:hypothetical protein
MLCFNSLESMYTHVLQDAYSLYHKQQEDNSSSTLGGPALPALGHALAGSTGTAISNLAIYPLDLIITRLQVQRQLRKSSSTPDEGEYEGVLDAAYKIYTREGGIPAFYSGVLQDTGKSIADSFLFFLFYNYLRQNRLQKHGGSSKSLPALDELGVGALAGACSKFFTTPLANIVTRKQTASMLASRSVSHSSEPSVTEIANQIRLEKGLQGFWSGYSASLILTLNPSLTFFLHSFFSRTLVPRSERDNPGARTTFLLAAVSKAIASSITYPFSLAKTRAQISSRAPIPQPEATGTTEKTLSASNTKDAKAAGKEAGRTAARSTVFSTILKIYRDEGLSALYEGIFGEILKGFFSHGMTMIVKEAVHKFIIQAYLLILQTLNKLPSPQEALHQANEATSGVFVKASERASSAVQSAKEGASQTLDHAKSSASDAYTTASHTLGTTLNSGKEHATDLAEKAGIVGNNATETVKTAASQGIKVEEYASQEAGHLLGNAQEQIGGKLIDIGKGMKED